MHESKFKKVHKRCPICGSDNFRNKLRPWNIVNDPIRLYGAASGLPGTQEIVECSSCGMIFENPRFDDEVILLGYMESLEAGHDSQYEMRVSSFYRTLKSLTEYLPKTGARILDIGTAGGAFLEAAKKFGYQATGLEPSRYLVEQGKKRGADIHQGTIEEHRFDAHSFDVVCLWDVIEHLPNPKKTLERILPLLKEHGVLLINYPDIGTWQAKIAGRRFWWLLSVHLHYFTRDTIQKICNVAGYEVFHMQRYWQSLQFGYLEDMAIHYKIPLSYFIKSITPRFIQNIPIPYYASQTTVLARIKR